MIFRTTPRYLQPIESIDIFDRIYKIDYYPHLNHWQAYTFLESIDRASSSIVVVTIDSVVGTNTSLWTRPHIDAIVAERNSNLICHFLAIDLVAHL